MKPSTAMGLAVLGASAIACQDLPEIRYETSHLRIGTEFDEPLCGGNLEHLELLMTTLEQLLDTSIEHPVDVYIWDPRRAESPGWCMHDYDLGCVEGGVVYTDLIALDHELVHVVAAELGHPAAFWTEGAAEALQSDRTLWGNSEPAANLELEPPQLRYMTAGHFTRWVFETYGIELFRQLMRSSGDARQSFEEIYEVSFEDAQTRFYEEAPYSYGALVACEHPELEQVDALTWSQVLDVDCAATDVHSTPFGMGVYRVLTIAERGYYQFSTSAELGTISRCADEGLEGPPSADGREYGDVPPVTGGAIYKYVRSFEGSGATSVYELVPGRYEVAVGFSDFETQAANLEVRAAPGPVPQVPGAP